MLAIRSLVASLGASLVTLIVAPSAFAGCSPMATTCGSVQAPVHYAQPFNQLRNFAYQNVPNVNVLRVQTGPAAAPLSQGPSGYWGGCANASGAPAYGGCASRVAPAPIVRPAVVSYPQPAPVSRTYYGSGYDASKFTPRQYGDNVLTPGIAHLSSTIVNRDPAALSSVIHSGQTVAQPVATGPGGWKQVSGPTMIDGMMATQVVCRQPATAPVARTTAYRVVRPVIGVRYPVPVQAQLPYCAQ